jgi:hypothetical protein
MRLRLARVGGEMVGLGFLLVPTHFDEDVGNVVDCERHLL